MMKFYELINGIEGALIVGGDVDVCGIAYNTSAVVRGSVFVAMRGTKVNGENFAHEAVERGAAAIVSENEIKNSGATNAIVPDARKALALIASKFFGNPSMEMKIVGVTGTNGKTTTTYLLEAILSATGKKPGVIGTVEYRFCGVKENAPHTTPESLDLQRLLRRMRDAGSDCCAMEVSSHALSQGRVVGTEFDAAIFTNLTPEHLDYHGDMESYFEAKLVLFEELLKKSRKRDVFAVINADDPYGARLAEKCPVHKIMFGFNSAADVRGTSLTFDASGLKMKIETRGGSMDISSRLCGRFNALNILGAVAVAQKMGVDAKTIAQALESVGAVPGRFEAVQNSAGVLALVDYAHTPDALENVLSNARELMKNGARLITVFGCGGDRDRKKRPIMGEAVSRLSDIAIVTSDNPRTEDPVAIIKEITPGMKNEHEVISDRRAAIFRGVALAKKGDVLVVAGKGHEDYQIVGTTKHHFDDKEVLKEAFYEIYGSRHS